MSPVRFVEWSSVATCDEELPPVSQDSVQEGSMSVFDAEECMS